MRAQTSCLQELQHNVTTKDAQYHWYIVGTGRALEADYQYWQRSEYLPKVTANNFGILIGNVLAYTGCNFGFECTVKLYLIYLFFNICIYDTIQYHLLKNQLLFFMLHHCFLILTHCQGQGNINYLQNPILCIPRQNASSEKKTN